MAISNQEKLIAVCYIPLHICFLVSVHAVLAKGTAAGSNDGTG